MLQRILQGNYGYGWDDLVSYDMKDREERVADLEAYEKNEPGVPHRFITRYVKGPTKPKTQKQ